MSERVPLVLRLEDWPQADRSAWERLFADGDLFEGAVPCRGWSEGSRRKRRQGYAQWLSFLRRTDQEALMLPPADRITEERVRAYLKECDARLKPQSVVGLFTDILCVGNAIDPSREWNWLRMVLNRLIARADRRALPPPVGVTSGRIFRWGLDRMAEVEADAGLRPMAQAIRFRQALIIAFLIARPVRRRALLAMCVDSHLVPLGAGFELRFPART